MTNKNRNRNIGLGVVAIVVIAFAVLIISPDVVNTDGVGTFRIPTLSIINSTGSSATSVPIGEIFCKVRQETVVYSNTGSVITTLESNTLQGTPFTALSFTFDPETGEEVSHFVITPKVFCTQENNLPIQVTFPRSLGFSVNLQSCPLDGASGQRGDFACTGNNAILGAGVRGGTYNFGSGQSETNMSNYVVQIETIEKTIGDVDLSSRLTFSVYGDMKIAYRDSSGCPDCSQYTYDFNIPFKTIQTFYKATILKAPPPQTDTDSDGIIDFFDDCPMLPETYNGFEDSDGCPDIRPPDVAQAPTPPTIVVEETTPIPDTSTSLTCGDTAIGVDDNANNVICIQQCSLATSGQGTWTKMIGVQTTSFGSTWNNGSCTVDDEPAEVVGMTLSAVETESEIMETITQPLEDIIESITTPMVQDVTIGQITEPIVTEEEVSVSDEEELDDPVIFVPSTIPPPLFDPTQPVDTAQAQVQTITSGLPQPEGIAMSDIIILLIIGIVIVAVIIVIAKRR